MRWQFGLAYTYLSPELKHNEGVNISKYSLENLKHQLINTVGFSYSDFSINLTNRFNERLSYKSYWVSDIRMSYDFKKYNFYVDALNLFDTTYIEAGAVPMPGRWFTVGVKFNGL